MTKLLQLNVKLGQQFGSLCSNCGSKLDYNVHGYSQKYGHCKNCGHCDCAERYGAGKCNAK